MEGHAMIPKLKILLRLAPLVGILAACQGGGSASQAVENYLQAVVEGDWIRAVSLSCAEWEEGARVEASSFEAVEAKLEGVSCSVETEQGEVHLVSCQGMILATYGVEDQEMALEGRRYRVINEGGEWRMCGYQ
jgi:hypothetical protein